MMLAADLHLHSGLSPCSDNDMTPNNVIHMAQLKGLDVIAITDHNSTKNLQSFVKVSQKNNITLIPGVEITTKEEVHLLALFHNLSQASRFQEVLDETLPKIPNNTKLFGNQYIYDEEDNILDDYSIMLISAISLTLQETIKEIINIGGIPIPAHIDRQSFSILSNLGFISPELPFQLVEITKACDYGKLEGRHPYLSNYKKIISSDAHRLGDISERSFFIRTASRDSSEILTNLRL